MCINSLFFRNILKFTFTKSLSTGHFNFTFNQNKWSNCHPERNLGQQVEGSRTASKHSPNGQAVKDTCGLVKRFETLINTGQAVKYTFRLVKGSGILLKSTDQLAKRSVSVGQDGQAVKYTCRAVKDTCRLVKRSGTLIQNTDQLVCYGAMADWSSGLSVSVKILSSLLQIEVNGQIVPCQRIDWSRNR